MEWMGKIAKVQKAVTSHKPTPNGANNHPTVYKILLQQLLPSSIPSPPVVVCYIVMFYFVLICSHSLSRTHHSPLLSLSLTLSELCHVFNPEVRTPLPPLLSPNPSLCSAS